MRTQFVEFLDNGTLDWPAFGPPRQDEAQVFARRYWNRRGRAPTDSILAPHVAVDRLLIQFFASQKVEVGQKSGVAGAKQTSNNLSAPEPTFLHKNCGGFVGDF